MMFPNSAEPPIDSSTQLAKPVFKFRVPKTHRQPSFSAPLFSPPTLPSFIFHFGGIGASLTQPSMRKIRVICRDPYATDYSSDDHDDDADDSVGANAPTVGKLLVHEISLFKPAPDSGTFSTQNRMEGVFVAQKGHSDANDSSREDGPAKGSQIMENDGSVSENNKNLTYPGLRMTASGKWGVQIYRPYKLWCGSHDTIKEAINACEKKKIEQAMLWGITMKNKVREANHTINCRARQRLVIDNMTVLETVTGKWAAWIRDQVSDARTWLGLYATPEEAVESYNRMKLELDSNCNLESLGKGSSSMQGNPQDAVENNNANLESLGKASSSVQGNPQDAVENNNAQDIASLIDTDVASFRRPGIKLTKKGRWGVRIQHPRKDSRQWLGSYDTLEEAAEVYDKKKIELEADSSGSHGGEIGTTTAGIGNEESCVVDKEIPAHVASTEVIDSQGLRMRYKGVRLRTSGRWSAETRDPRKGRKVHLGTFDTPEEAVAVYNKKKRQIEARICQGKMRSLKDIVEAETVTLASEAGVIPEAVEARMPRGKKRKSKDCAEADTDGLASVTVAFVPEAVVVIKTEPNSASPALTLEAENSTVTAVSGLYSEGSNNNNENQIHSSSMEDGEGFGFNVINCHGEYVGEYSRMDDELLVI